MTELLGFEKGKALESKQDSHAAWCYSIQVKDCFPVISKKDAETLETILSAKQEIIEELVKKKRDSEQELETEKLKVQHQTNLWKKAEQALAKAKTAPDYCDEDCIIKDHRIEELQKQLAEKDQQIKDYEIALKKVHPHIDKLLEEKDKQIVQK